MKNWRKKKMEYQHQRDGELVKVEIRDSTRRIIYRNKFNINDKNAMLNLLSILEQYSNFSITNLVKEKLKIGDWF